MGPDIWNDTNKWIRDTWHVPRSGKSTWFPANKTLTHGTSLLVEHSEGHISLDDPWPRGQLMIVEKNPTPYSSMMVVLINGVCPWKSGRGNLVLSETGRTRIRNDLVLIIISSWANCTINITVSTLGITPRSVIDKIDGNHCQRQLDQSGQTTRYQKQL